MRTTEERYEMIARLAWLPRGIDDRPCVFAVYVAIQAITSEVPPEIIERWGWSEHTTTFAVMAAAWLRGEIDDKTLLEARLPKK